MDFGIKYADVDQSIAQYKEGANIIAILIGLLQENIGNFESDGFTGQSADKYMELMRRKIKLTQDLQNVWNNMSAQLENAKHKAQEADEELNRRIRAI
ncbi:MAG: WXG100 family type VII secretion target [Anaerolineae bacterium]|nr:WXG100 family type VII secretion target [Anaerolineae bacterium]